MQFLYSNRWNAISAILANAPALYPMKVVYKKGDKTTFIILATTTATSIVSALSECNNEPLTTALNVANTLALSTLAVRICYKSNEKYSQATYCYALAQLLNSSIVLSLYLIDGNMKALYTHRIISYLLLGLYLQSVDKLK